MKAFPVRMPKLWPLRASWKARSTAAALVALLSCMGLEAQQRKLIFQVGQRTDEAAEQLEVEFQDTWIDYAAADAAAPVRLHAWWFAQARHDAPVMLYLHGARFDLRGSLHRMQALHALGFAVLGIDYRGFGQSTPGLPSERMACEDARAAWAWLGRCHPGARRFIYGHSLGGAIAVQLASEIDDSAGLIVEGTFTSIPEVFGTMKWGWLPIAPLITERFDSAQRVTLVRSPLLVVHGSDDETIHPDLGRALFERAASPKRFLLVQGGSHHDTHVVGHAQVREALRELFALTV
ncbi:MAG TPA: alpha/beta fold hydrolase [Albitalea sp.]|uniref:alpha/beta hydrolase n=1 Tax=Piscinibacter sp. TaxID=1903157 RepID=UPI002ED4FF45